MFEVFSDEKRNLVTFVTNNLDKDFLSLKEIKYQVNNEYEKLGPIPQSSDLGPNSDKNKWIIIYTKKN